MDLGFNETQNAIRMLCKDLFSKTVTVESLQQLEAENSWFHKKAWDGLIESQLLGLAIPEEDDGAGLGLIELCLVLQQIGRHVAPIPFMSSIVTGAMPLARFGTSTQKKDLLPGLLAGTSFMTAALVDAHSNEPSRPATHAKKEGDTWILDGEKSCVPDIHLATQVIIPARVGEQLGIFLVDTAAIEVSAQESTNGEPLGFLDLSGVSVKDDALLGSLESGADILDWILQRAMLAQCALKLGIAEKSLFMTAEYTSQRKQFGIPVGSFQAVSQRAADAYINLAVMKVALWRAAWQLDTGLDASKAMRIAMYWSAEAGHHVSFSAQHLHGGMGFDRDYPLHRYFLWSKHHEFTLGGANAHLEALGKYVAQNAG